MHNVKSLLKLPPSTSTVSEIPINPLQWVTVQGGRERGRVGRVEEREGWSTVLQKEGREGGREGGREKVMETLLSKKILPKNLSNLHKSFRCNVTNVCNRLNVCIGFTMIIRTNNS